MTMHDLTERVELLSINIAQAKEIERLTDALTANDDAELDAYAAGKKDAEARLQARVAVLEGVVRDAHYEGYMAGVGDSEDYDHDAIVMEKEAWKEYLAATEQEADDE